MIKIITFFGFSFYLVTRLGNPFMYNPAFQSFSKEITQLIDKLVISCPTSQLLYSLILLYLKNQMNFKLKIIWLDNLVLTVNFRFDREY